MTGDMLGGAQWRRLHPRVWVHRDHEMTHLDTIAAAAMSMPGRAHLSHESLLQALGLDVGSHLPVHFTVAGDLHIATDDIFLHRTVVLPPTDARGVTPASAFIQYCATATVIDAVIAGDWLLHRDHMSLVEVAELAARDTWRPGALSARRVLRDLDARSASPQESRLRMVLAYSGLPSPQVNADIEHGGRRIAIVDLLYARWRLVVEYEGRQHALDRRQFGRDIVRYSDLRGADYEYIQVTFEMLEQPRAVVMTIHQALVRRGYDGRSPVFGDRFNSLFEPIPVQPRSAR